MIVISAIGKKNKGQKNKKYYFSAPYYFVNYVFGRFG